MKKALRIMSLILILALTLQISAFADFISYEGYNDGEYISVKGLKFTDSETGEEITSLSSGQTIHVSAYIKSDKVINPALVMMLYSNGSLAGVVTGTNEEADGGIKLSGEINTGNKQGLSLFATVWNGINSVSPIAEKAIFASDNADVEEIYIDGEKLEDFLPGVYEYNYNLSAGYNDYPSVSVKTMDLSAKVKITELYSFNSEEKKVNVHVTSQDNTNSSDYIINFTQDNAAITNIESAQGKTVSLLCEPQRTNDASGEEPLSYGTSPVYLNGNYPTLCSKPYTDKNFYYMDINPKLLSSYVISVPYSASSLAFDINHSAEIYVCYEEGNDGGAFEGFSKTETMLNIMKPSDESYTYSPAVTYMRAYTVPDNRKEHISLPQAESGAPYSVIVRFVDESRISSASYTLRNGNKVQAETTEFYGEYSRTGEYDNLSGCLYAPKIFADSENEAVGFDSLISSGEALVLPFTSGTTQSISKISLKINRSSSVYFIIQSANANGIKALTEDNYIKYNILNGGYILTDSSKISFPSSDGAIFKKEYYLAPGEEKEISFENIPSTVGNVAVIAGDINSDYFDKTNAIEIKENEINEFEAEDERANINLPFVKDSTYVSSGATNNYAGVIDDSKMLSYDLAVEKSGNYYLWLKFLASVGHDSCFITIDDFSPTMFSSMPVTGDYTYRLYKSFYLSRGRHTLKIYNRVAKVYFDKFALTDKFNSAPSGGEVADGNYYDLPPVYPEIGKHPRLLITNDNIETIRSNLNHEQNIEVYNKVLENSEYATSGLFPADDTKLSGTNYDYNALLCAEACAFLYAVNGDTEKGRKAVTLYNNMIESYCADKTYESGLASRTGGYIITVLSFVYDWCYDLLSEAEKSKLVEYVHHMAYRYETGWPPTKLSNVIGHGLEGEIQKDFLSAAVACYDEDQTLYNNYAGRIFSQIAPMKRYYAQSLHLAEGANYGPFREFYSMFATYVFDALGYKNIYSEEYKNAFYSLFYNRKPDGRYISSGDDANEEIWGHHAFYAGTGFMAANYFKDPYLKKEYYKNIQNGLSAARDGGQITSVMHLIMNDVNVLPSKSYKELPLTAFYGYPSGVMSARTGWSEGLGADNLVVQMNIQQKIFGGHQHFDSGHFDIYYKGSLALDSGIYESAPMYDEEGNEIKDIDYASPHDMAYHKRTIAHNSMLIYDPDETMPNRYFPVNDGGQRTDSVTITTYEEAISDINTVGEVLSYDFGEDVYEPEYSYLKGDMTKAYSDKITGYSRAFMFLNFKNSTYPGALIVYDNVTSSNADFKKTWLLHSQLEPEISGNTFKIIKNNLPGEDGRLINTTLLPENSTITKVGGEGNEFSVNGINYPSVPKTIYDDCGVWRIELSPASKSQNDKFLNVMQMGTASENAAPLETELISSDSRYYGVKIYDRAVFLNKENALNSSDITLEYSKGSDNIMFICDGLEKGVWTVYNESNIAVTTKEVYDGHNTLSFTAAPGKYIIKHTSSSNTTSKNYSVFDRMREITVVPPDIKISSNYYTFESSPRFINGIVYIPAKELAEMRGKTYKYSSGVLTINNQKINATYYRNYSNVVYVNIEKTYDKFGFSSYEYDPIGNICRLR